MYYFYAIIERSFNFCVLKTGFGELQSAWDEANRLQKQYPDLIEDADVLVFNTEKEQLEYLRNNTK